MSNRIKSTSTVYGTNVIEDDDPYELLRQTAILLGDKPEPFMKGQKDKGLAARSKSIFIPAILQSIVTPSTLKITNLHI
jgi:hypothetical protein